MPDGQDMMAGLAGRIVSGLAVLAALLVLTACGTGGNRPFSKSTGPSGRPPPTVSIVAMNGMPADKAKLLADLIQESAAKHDVAVIDQDFGDSWKLTGEFLPQREADGTAGLVYAWSLRDARGQTVHQISGTQALGPAGPDPWTAVSPDALRAIAQYTAQSIAGRLSQLGYASSVAGLTPPSDAFARAGPNAEKELDYETLYGNRAALAGADPRTGTGQPATAAQPSADIQQASAEPELPPALPAHDTAQRNAGTKPQQEKPSRPGARAIRGVTVTRVSGSPGNGNAELASAMRQALGKAGWPVYDKPRPDALNIAGRVALSEPRGSNQQVALSWTVTSPEGKDLGTIRQTNMVPAGSLDAGWGETAGYAAQAGAEGIFELVGKLR